MLRPWGPRKPRPAARTARSGAGGVPGAAPNPAPNPWPPKARRPPFGAPRQPAGRARSEGGPESMGSRQSGSQKSTGSRGVGAAQGRAQDDRAWALLASGSYVSTLRPVVRIFFPEPVSLEPLWKRCCDPPASAVPCSGPKAVSTGWGGRADPRAVCFIAGSSCSLNPEPREQMSRTPGTGVSDGSRSSNFSLDLYN